MNTHARLTPITTRPRAPARFIRMWLAIVTLLALLVPATAARASGTNGTAPVNVYYTPAGSECDVLRAFTRTVATPAVLTGALEELLAGPTRKEAKLLATQFSSETADMLRSVAIRDGVARVDFKDLDSVIPGPLSSCDAASMQSQLDATVTQFSTVDDARYTINGSEAAFATWLHGGWPEDGTTVRGSLANTAAISRANGEHPTLRRIRAGRHGDFDRLVFEFDGDGPSYTVGYAAVARSGGSGAPIFAGGTVALQITLGAHTVDLDDPGFPLTYTPKRLSPHMPTLRKVRYGGEYEGQAVFAAGLKGRSGFRVIELANPTRLAIDVAHGAKVRWLRKGRNNRGDDVRDWQEQLNTVQHGHFRSSWKTVQGPLQPDGVFGPRTVRATRRFQRAEGIWVNGVVNRTTRQAMRDAIRRASRIPA